MTNLARHICALAPLPAGPADRIELMPLGEFRLGDQRGARAMRLVNAAAVIAASLAAAPGGVLPIDFDHRSFAGQGVADSRAAGWITALAVEGDRILASVEWTAEGRRALEDRSYRFVSPVFKTRPDGEVALIEGAGLVNNPALPQLRQLASKETLMDPIAQIAGALGLAADKPEDIVARVTALAAAETQLASLRSAAPDPAQFVPKTAFDQLQTQFASLQKDVRADKVEAALEKAREAGKLTPDLDAWATQLASKDLAEFEAWVAVAPVRVELARRQLAGKVPPRAAADGLDPLERQVASRMGVSEAEFLKSRTTMQEA